jgi:hypothetical protein
MTGRMRAVAVETAAKINGRMGLVMIGGQSPGDAIGNIQTLLEGSPRRRAITVVRTEIGRAFATATQAQMVQACVSLPHMAHWEMATPRKRPFTEEEIRLNPLKQEIAEGKPLSVYLPK